MKSKPQRISVTSNPEFMERLSEIFQERRDKTKTYSSGTGNYILWLESLER